MIGVRFARAVLARDPEADVWREEIALAKRWEPRAVLALAFGVLASQMYPVIKYALGHGKACGAGVVVADQGGDAEASCMTEFEPHPRRFLLVGIAYRMLGSIAEAEDIVQDEDACLRVRRRRQRRQRPASRAHTSLGSCRGCASTG